MNNQPVKHSMSNQIIFPISEYLFVARIALILSFIPLLAIVYLESLALAVPFVLGQLLILFSSFAKIHTLLPRAVHLLSTSAAISLIGMTQLNLVDLDSAAAVIFTLPLLMGLYLYKGLMRWINILGSCLIFLLAIWTQIYMDYKPSSVAPQYYGYFSVSVLIGFTGFIVAIISRVNGSFNVINARLIQEKNRYQTLFNNAPEAYLILSANDGALLECNYGLERMLGGTHDQLLGKYPYELSPEKQPDGRSSASGIAKIARTVVKQGEMKFEWVHKRMNGEPFWVEVEIRSGFYMDQQVFFSTWREIGARKRLEQKLFDYANNDQLTGLPNRRLLRDSFDWAISRADRESKQISLMFIDVDNFKYVNDVYGHNLGDQLLIGVANRLQSNVRQGDVCARLGGDEFVLVIEHLENEKGSEKVVKKLMDSFQEPFEVSNQSILATLSIGIAVYPDDGDCFDELMRCADTAMYRAKSDGRSQYCFYSEDMAIKAAERLKIESGLRTALDNGEFRLVYQPLVNLETGFVEGVEALVRWHHPTEGMIPPIDFLPIAEDSALIERLEAWIFNAACSQAVEWHKAGIRFGILAINASARALQRGYAATLLEQTLKDTGCSAALVELEISENFVMSKSEQGIEQLQQIRNLGVSLSLDDFGTGFSSLSYVTRMPLSKLKIDKSLITNIITDRDNREIVSATIAMAKRLNLVTVAEGIESREQSDLVRSEGCDIGQGYLYSYPLSAIDCERALRDAMNGAHWIKTDTTS